MSYNTYEVRVFDNGTESWWLNGERHRENGPACTRHDGYKAWWLNNVLHREDGPAVIHSDGRKEYWLNNKLYTEEQFNAEMQSPNARKQPRIVEIDGKKYELKEVDG